MISRRNVRTVRSPHVLRHDPPLLPGTRARYKVRGCLCRSVGFRGYFGGFPASWVISDRELASTCGAIAATSASLWYDGMISRKDTRKQPRYRNGQQRKNVPSRKQFAGGLMLEYSGNAPKAQRRWLRLQDLRSGIGDSKDRLPH